MCTGRSSIWRWRSPTSHRSEFAVRFTGDGKYLVSEASIYWLLKAYDFITSPAYVVINATNEFNADGII